MTITEQLDQRHQENLRRLRSFRLLDDYFFTKCFEGNIDCVQLILRIILDRPDLIVVDVRTQVFVESLFNRSVQLDILATDGSGRKINIEIQREDRGAVPKRARFNSSMLDSMILEKGKNFEQLVDTFIVFITEHDVIGRGLPVYQIERCVLQTGERFEDGAHILYVNGAYRDDTPIGKLMHDLSCIDPADMYYGVLADRVRFFKESEEGVAIMCKTMEDMCNQVVREGMIAVAKKMLSDGVLTIEKIAEYVGLSLDEVRKLQAGQLI